LSHEYWQQKFGGDRSVIGRVLEMNNRPHTVVGVLPPHPQYPRYNDVYMPTSACPFRAQAQQTDSRRAFGSLRVFGRLGPGQTAERATAEIAMLAGAFDDRFPDVYATNGKRGEVVSRLQPLKEELVQGARPMLAALAGTTLLVLLIACANVANLALARTVRRSRELAVRSALGAGRGRLVRLLLTESVLVAGAGGLLGLWLAWLSLDMLTSFVARFTPRTGEIDIDGGVLLFTLAAAVASGVTAGLLPALSTRRNVAQSMRDGAAQAGDSVAKGRLRAGLVVGQVAVSFVLLVGAALLLESFFRLASVPLGYRTEQVMTAAINGNFTRMSTEEDAQRIQHDVLERLRASPGVVSAAVTNAVPQSTLLPGPRAIEVEHLPPGTRPLNANANVASDGYFDTLGVPILAGRDFRGSDTSESLPVAIVNQAMARFWEKRNPIGSRFTVVGGARSVELTVVGVAGDFRMYGADQDVPAQFYLPLSQSGFGGGRVLVRTNRDASMMVPIIKAAVHQVDDAIPVEEIRTLAEIRNDRLAVPGLTATLLSVFAFVALLVTLAGIAGVTGTAVSQRTREFGLRMALGASRGSVLVLVLGQGVKFAAIGAVIGVAGAWAFGRLIGRFLFETAPTEPAAYAAVALVFLVAALAAAFGPARRATAIDPLSALKSE
jgi:predicted permease